MRGLIIAVVAAILMGCASDLYRPADPYQRVGYTDGEMGDGRFYVTFAGAPTTPQEETLAFAVRRAAEITLANGRDWFEVVGQLTEDQREDLLLLAASIGRTDSFFGSTLGRIPPRLPAYVVLEFIVGDGPKPDAADRFLFDARAVLARYEAASG